MSAKVFFAKEQTFLAACVLYLRTEDVEVMTDAKVFLDRYKDAELPLLESGGMRASSNRAQERCAASLPPPQGGDFACVAVCTRGYRQVRESFHQLSP